MFGFSTDHIEPTLLAHHLASFEKAKEKLVKDFIQLRELYTKSASNSPEVLAKCLAMVDEMEKNELAKLAMRAWDQLDQLAFTGRHLHLMGKQEPAYKHGMRQGREDPVDIK